MHAAQRFDEAELLAVFEANATKQRPGDTNVELKAKKAYDRVTDKHAREHEEAVQLVKQEHALEISRASSGATSTHLRSSHIAGVDTSEFKSKLLDLTARFKQQKLRDAEVYSGVIRSVCNHAPVHDPTCTNMSHRAVVDGCSCRKRADGTFNRWWTGYSATVDFKDAVVDTNEIATSPDAHYIPPLEYASIPSLHPDIYSRPHPSPSSPSSSISPPSIASMDPRSASDDDFCIACVFCDDISTCTHGCI